jgi:hypothetical protein
VAFFLDFRLVFFLLFPASASDGAATVVASALPRVRIDPRLVTDRAAWRLRISTMFAFMAFSPRHLHREDSRCLVLTFASPGNVGAVNRGDVPAARV